MKGFLVFLLLLVSTSVSAQTALSIRFGTTNIVADGLTSSGTGIQLQGETFLVENSGLVFSVGQFNTESSSNVIQGGTIKPEIVVNSTYLNLGAFYYITEPLRVSAGISTNNLSVKSSTELATESYDTSLAGPFASISYMLQLGGFALGLEYFYTQFGEFTQSNLIFILGISF